jgi:hypothetical protein
MSNPGYVFNSIMEINSTIKRLPKSAPRYPGELSGRVGRRGRGQEGGLGGLHEEALDDLLRREPAAHSLAVRPNNGSDEMNDPEWEQLIDKAKQSDQVLKQGGKKRSDACLNLLCALISPICLAIGFTLTSPLAELLVFSVWGLGGLFSLGVLAAYGYTNNVSHKIKEAALSFMLGNLLVTFAFVLKPT